MLNKYHYLAILCLLPILLLAYGGVTYYKASNNIATDFTSFYESVHAYHHQESIYTRQRQNLYFTTKGMRAKLSPLIKYSENLNPPFVVSLILPFAYLSYSQAFIIWTCLSLLLGFMATLLLLKTFTLKLSSTKQILLSIILLLAYFPTYANIAYGQFGLILYFFLICFWLSARKGRDNIAGVILGFTLGMKLFLGLFLIYFLLLRRWRLLCYAMITFLLTLLIGAWVFGSAAYINYWHVIHSIDWYSASWNASLLGLVTRLLGQNNASVIVHWSLQEILSYAVLAITCFYLYLRDISLIQSQQHEHDSASQFDIGFCLTLVTMLLLSPLGWLYYFPLLLLVFLLCFSFMYSYQLSSYWIASMFLAFILTNWPVGLAHHIASGWLQLFSSNALACYGLLLLFSNLIIVRKKLLIEPQAKVIAVDSLSVWQNILPWLFLPSILCVVFVIPHVF